MFVFHLFLRKYIYKTFSHIFYRFNSSMCGNINLYYLENCTRNLLNEHSSPEMCYLQLLNIRQEDIKHVNIEHNSSTKKKCVYLDHKIYNT